MPSIAEVESFDLREDGRAFYAYLRLADGRCALWQFEFHAPAGQAQSINVLQEGA